MKPLTDEAGELNKQLLAALPAFDQAQADVPGLRELVAQRSKNRVAFRQANKVSANERTLKLGEEFKALGAKLDELTTAKPEAKKAVVDREKILKALGDNRDKIEPLDKVVKERGNTVQFKQELGGLVGRIILAILLVTAIAKRTLLRLFIVPGIAAFPVVYFQLYHGGGDTFDWGIFACGLLVVAQFSYFGEYLPKIFPLHLRGTGGSFATNVGGRMIGTSAAFLTTNILAPQMSGLTTFDKVATASAIVGTGVFIIGLALTFLLPEPTAQPSE